MKNEANSARNEKPTAGVSRPGRLQVQTSMEYLVASLDAIGAKKPALSLAKIAVKRRLSLTKSKMAPLKPIKLSSADRIMISGYFYSGSGALADYLLGFERTKKWTPGGEMRLIKSPGGMLDFSKKYFDGRKEEALLNLCLTMLGSKVTDIPTWKSSNRSSRKLIANAKSRGYVIRELEFWLDLNANPPESVAEFSARSAKFFEKAFDAAATGHNADRLIIDQAINAWRLHLGKFVPPSVFLVVDRDPRDHFAEARVGWRKVRNKHLTAEEYVNTYETIREKSRAQANRATKRHGHRFHFYSFEDFVTDHKTSAEKLCSDLNIGGVSEGYDPEQSRPNIGKYKAVLTPSESGLIESRLSKYLHPAAD